MALQSRQFKFKEYVGERMTDLRRGLLRFIYCFFYTLAVFLTLSYMIVKETPGEYASRALMAFVLGGISSIFLRLIYEKVNASTEGKTRLKPYMLEVLSAVAAVACYFASSGVQDGSVYILMAYFGVLCALILLIVWLLHMTLSKEDIIAHLIKSFIFCMAVSLVLYGGLAVVIFAVDSMLIKIAEVYKLYLILAAFLFGVVAVNLFLADLPQKDEEIKIPKIFKILVAQIFLPVYLLLFVILYLYFFKILFTWSIPGGQINWFASYASLFYIFFHLTIARYAEENRLTAFFIKFGSYLLIPVLALQWIAIWIRVDAYGLTTPRYISIVLNIIVLLFVILTLIKKSAYRGSIFVIAALFALAITVTPLNTVDIPDMTQFERMKTVLLRNGMYENGTIKPNPNISNEDKEIITSTYQYLAYSGGNKYPEINQGKRDVDYYRQFEQLFGFAQYYPTSPAENTNYRYYYSSYDTLNVSGYDRLYNQIYLTKEPADNIREDNPNIEITIGGQTYSFSIYPTLSGLNTSENNSSKEISGEPIAIDIDANTRFYLTDMQWYLNPDGSMRIDRLSGVALVRG